MNFRYIYCGKDTLLPSSTIICADCGISAKTFIREKGSAFCCHDATTVHRWNEKQECFEEVEVCLPCYAKRYGFCQNCKRLATIQGKIDGYHYCSECFSKMHSCEICMRIVDDTKPHNCVSPRNVVIGILNKIKD